MLRDVNDRVALSESLKLPVEIPAHFAGDLASCFVAMPSLPMQGVSGTIQLQGHPYTYFITPTEIFGLTRQHEKWQSKDDVRDRWEEVWQLPVYSSADTYRLTFDPDDLSWLFFTIDKVISGADSVPLLGSILAELEVPPRL